MYRCVHKSLDGFQSDEVYTGTAEERAKGEMGDYTIHLGAGHIARLPGSPANEPNSLKLLKKDPSVANRPDGERT